MWLKGGRVTSIERTVYPQFKRLPSTWGLYVFFTPAVEEIIRGGIGR